MQDTGETRGAGPSPAWPYLLLALVLFGVGVAAWRPIPAGVWHDDGVYMLVGKALAEGRGLVYAGVVDTPPAAKFPPLYPLTLAGIWRVFGGIGPVTMAATFLNLALLGGAAALFARALVAGAGMGLRPALAVAALAFASTDVLRAALVPLSESFFLFLSAAALAAWPRLQEGRRGWSWVVAGLLLALVATRTAGLALVAAFGLALVLRGRPRAAAGVVAPSVAFLAVWSRWSGRASQEITEGARDLLGPYGGWLLDQTVAAPGAFLAALPTHALGVFERAAALTFPGVTTPWLWALGAAAAPLVAAGMVQLVRRFPPLGWFGLVYLAVLLIWPYLDRRLLVPWHPALVAALFLGGQQILSRARTGVDRVEVSLWLQRFVLGCGVVWVVGYTSVTSGRIAEGWPTAPYRLRADRLAASVEALSRTAPPDAIVGAPEFWAALHLHGGWTVSPSVRFDPRRVDGETPTWGTAEEQLALWQATGVDHLLLEQNGMLHGDALDRLEEACPGSVVVLARMVSAMVVRLDRVEGCVPP